MMRARSGESAFRHARSASLLLLVLVGPVCGDSTEGKGGGPGTGGTGGAAGTGGSIADAASNPSGSSSDGASSPFADASTSGNGDAGTAGRADAGASASGFPCEVERILAARCQTCHQQPPQFGAPMPLLTWQDTRAMAPSGGTVWEGMKRMVSGGYMPPDASPSGALTAQEKASLLAWLDSGAPAGTAACAGGANGVPPSGSSTFGPAALSCKPSHEFRAHGTAPTDPFPVPSSGEVYRCFNFQVPFATGEQATAWAPIIDDARVVHHWILYAQKSEPKGCEGLGLERTFLMGWAPGGQNYALPPDVGLDLPEPGTWLSLEIHYNNKARHEDARDRSGVAVCTTRTPRAKEAGVVTLGNVKFTIPPRAENHTVTGECARAVTLLLPETLHVLGTFPHMHQIATSLRTDVLRGGNVLPLIDVPRWDFNNQRMYELDPNKVTVARGDLVRTVCTYRNSTDQEVKFGEKTTDEMCLNFVVVYPIAQLKNRKCVNPL